MGLLNTLLLLTVVGMILTFGVQKVDTITIKTLETTKGIFDELD